MNQALNRKTVDCDFCVIGGGLAGSFAALSAARHGARVVLLQDRPMLGGNASSEIRMWVRGAEGRFNRETGLLSELEERNIRDNPTLVPSLFDAALYGMVTENPNVTLFLNTSCMDAETEDGRIVSVTGWQLTTYTFVTVRAKIFADCSGDSILAPLVGAEYRVGRESREEFGETLAQPEADSKTMGLSIILAARETDHPVSFTPPPFANVYPDDGSFSGAAVETLGAHRRKHSVGTGKDNLWWIELGGNMDSIHDSDRVREELLRCVYGVWDHIKNRGGKDDPPHHMENWDLDWVGFLPGKRESRRYVGDVIVTESDLTSGGHFPDEIAFGGWPLDDHDPLGMAQSGVSPSHTIPVSEAYGLPYRALYSKNIPNLLFAGRNISVTHVALSSTRVMATCSLLGQAAGTAAGLCVRYGIDPRELGQTRVGELQTELMRDGMFLQHVKNIPCAALRGAECNLPDAQKEILMNGMERPRKEDYENAVLFAPGEELTFAFREPVDVGTLRIVCDPDFGHESVSEIRKMRVFTNKLHTGLDFRPVHVPTTIVRKLTVFADGEEAARIEDNCISLIRLPVGRRVRTLTLRFEESNGAARMPVYSVDLI